MLIFAPLILEATATVQLFRQKYFWKLFWKKLHQESELAHYCLKKLWSQQIRSFRNVIVVEIVAKQIRRFRSLLLEHHRRRRQQHRVVVVFVSEASDGGAAIIIVVIFFVLIKKARTIISVLVCGCSGAAIDSPPANILVIPL